MKTRIALFLSLVLAFGHAVADGKKADAKKSATVKTAGKKSDKPSDKNAAQKAESSLTDWADKNNLWKRSSKK